MVLASGIDVRVSQVGIVLVVKELGLGPTKLYCTEVTYLYYLFSSLYLIYNEVAFLCLE